MDQWSKAVTDRKNGTRVARKPLDDINPADIWAVFGKSPVLATETMSAYEKLRDMIVTEVQPRDMFEYAHLRRHMDLTWEAARYQRCATAIINITARDALKGLVAELAKDGIEGLSADQIVEGWFADTKIRLLVTERLQRYGFDEDTVAAQAVAMRSAELARISEMRTRAEAQANAHLREIERHRDAIGRPSMALLNAPADAGAEGRDARASA